MRFEVLQREAGGWARTGLLTLPHGQVRTPAFMPVGTKGSVKGVWPEQVAASGAEIILGNTYHLCQRPGAELIARLGGLHRFIGWPGPILTDSGGYQVFSLAGLNNITDEGVRFRSHIDGSWIHLDPVTATTIQHQLGADIIMAFDECPPGDADRGVAAAAVERTVRWAEQCKRAHEEMEAEKVEKSTSRKVETDQQTANDEQPTTDDEPSHSPPIQGGAGGGREGHNPHRTPLNPPLSRGDFLEKPRGDFSQALFGIVQGGIYPDLRRSCAERLVTMGFPGYAVGGLSVGETHEQMVEVLDGVVEHLPADRPRYLMGVGMPRDILAAVRAGIDMFDCVLPTRNGRNAYAFTAAGGMKLRNEKYRTQDEPLEAGCPCPTCRQFSRAYIRHLFSVGEMMGPILLTVHNLWFFQRFMARLRDLIPAGAWGTILSEFPIAGRM